MKSGTRSHDDGRRVAPEEMLSAIFDAVLAEREACAALAEEIAAGRDAEAIADAILGRSVRR